MKDYCPRCNEDMDEVEWAQFGVCFKCAESLGSAECPKCHTTTTKFVGESDDKVEMTFLCSRCQEEFLIHRCPECSGWKVEPKEPTNIGDVVHEAFLCNSCGTDFVDNRSITE